MSQKLAQFTPDSATIMDRSRGVFFSQWEELLQLRRAVLKSSGLDDTHDLRVATRRFRAALDLLYPFAQESTKAELRKSARNLTRKLGGLRNIDEVLIFFQSRAKADDSIVNRLCHSFSELRNSESKRIKKSLKEFDYHKLDRMARNLVAALNEDCITKQNRFSLLAYFSDVSIRLYLPIHQLLAVSTVPEHHESRHELRIAIKKWRYFFEIIAPVLDRDYSHILELLKNYQSILGRMNDIRVFGEMLDHLSLPQKERDLLEAILRTEDAVLLASLTDLIERKTLTYTFLI